LVMWRRAKPIQCFVIFDWEMRAVILPLVNLGVPVPGQGGRKAGNPLDEATVI
jgi:hypothetical protein